MLQNSPQLSSVSLTNTKSCRYYLVYFTEKGYQLRAVIHYIRINYQSMITTHIASFITHN